MMLIVAVALAALSCANKEAEKAEAEEPAKEQSLIERAVELGEDVAAEVEKNK